MRAGDLQAAEQVFVAYEPQLRLIVRRQLSRRLRAKFDSMDVVQSVWTHVLHDFRANGCRLAGADHLRNFLVQITRNCLIDRLRHFRAALASEQAAPAADKVSAAASRQPRPSEIAQGNELWENMLASCPPQYHDLLRLKRQGLTLDAIAARTGLHEGSVRRIIRQLARKMAFATNGTTA
ncbi:MAG TPA: sigma-70 family RNA polymerase sigma factor [Pirellulales bacterium]|nr:sigma-70 family RNA polymerase sigma factor [Pirellulales bacterium]